MKKYIIYLILGLFLIITTVACSNSTSSSNSLNNNISNYELAPSINSIKEMKHLKYIENNLEDSKENPTELKKYLDGLDTKALLSLTAEITHKYERPTDMLMLLVPYMFKLSDELDYETYSFLVSNKEYNDNFRHVMFNLFCGTRYIAEDESSSDLVKNKEEVLKTFRKVLCDSSESDYIKKISLTSIYDYDKSDIEMFDMLFNSEDYSDEFKGDALRIIYRFDRDYATKRINNILANPDDFSKTELNIVKELGHD